MKWCAFCGAENRQEAADCIQCATNEFTHEAPALAASQSNAEPAGEKALCTTCLHPNAPQTAFCKECGAPVGIISTVGPFERLFAEGFAYRQAVASPRKPIVLVGLWLIFLPTLLFLFLLPPTTPYGLVMSPVWMLSIFILYRATRNFLRQQPAGNP